VAPDSSRKNFESHVFMTLPFSDSLDRGVIPGSGLEPISGHSKVG
jgi:hypothetical protein